MYESHHIDAEWHLSGPSNTEPLPLYGNEEKTNFIWVKYNHFILLS